VAVTAAVVAAGLAAAPAHASSAGDQYVHPMGTRAAAGGGVGISSAGALGAGNLIYHLGPTMRTGSTTYTIFWQPSGAYMSPTYTTLINRYFADIGGSSLYNVTTQYYDSGGAIANSSTFGGTWTDTSPYPSRVLPDWLIKLEVVKAMRVNGWTGGLNHLFFVYIARGEQTCQLGACAFSTFCAYHGSFAVNGQPILYANMPYDGTNLQNCGPGGASPNSDPDADAAINVTSHEHMEAVTDPLGTAWYDASGNEIGDKCAWNFGLRGFDGGNVTLNGNRYIVQKEWSNAVHGCVLSQ
jgi:hypothetical protein